MAENVYPKTLVEFDSYFPDEEACWRYLVKIRWPDGFKCPKCGASRAWLTTRRLMHCSACNRQTSITAGTIFHRTRKPLRVWFQAMWWVSTQKTGGSARGLERILGMGTFRTAWTWLQKLRRTMTRTGRDKLSGFVEVDDAFVGGLEEGIRGRESVLKAKIVIAVEAPERRIGRIRIRHIEDFSAESLLPFIEENIETKSTVHTDGWQGYASLRAKGFTHKVSVIGDRKRASQLFPGVHRVISLLKRWLLGTHQGRVESKHLQRYLDEFTFRFNRRRSKAVGQIFFRLVQQAVVTAPESYRTIVGVKRRPKLRKIKPT